MNYSAILLKKRPDITITSDIFEKVSRTVPEIAEGEFLVKQTHMSLDPAMRGWMSADRESYIPPVELGEVMRSSGIGDVVESRHPDFPVGTRVMGMMGWTEYFVAKGGLSPVPTSVPQEALLSVVALPGVTAYHGLYEVLKPQAGQTLVVTGAAGSVGSMVGQLAKLEGVTVIGVAGSDEKCHWLTETLGFDAAINYHDEDFAAKLATAAPNGIDLFFENTGGVAQQHIYQRMNAHGRVAVCGMIADYNTATPQPGPNWMNIVRKRLMIQGFTMPDHFHRFAEYGQQLAELMMAGKLQYRAHTLQGLDSAIEGINLLFSGENKGKLIVEL
ncbi:NADP-dependent oxidoreductase [Photobacterium sp. 2_MG-2023]|uniref:NADP-dependent oxidoreductase n=1 Tax=Photobacterium sp. 2_MG-2023 TaxID=3062663 RepID=UPI0026E3F3DC|nr:NADP-dependent oxidoreductase [Photobacterium sp. 2_MG-2023]MDO6582840.1 NADP-dependent oxidoreductase [Photobacterium sp. 2_MG-2023]